MSNSDRMKFFLPISVAGYLTAFLVVLGIYLLSFRLIRQQFNPGDVIFFAAFSFPLGCWLLLRTVQIIRRYNSRGSATSA